MVEVTLGKNLVVCERPTFPVLNPLIDLTADLAAARRIVVAAERFFSPCMDAVYSGWARASTRLDGYEGAYGPVYYIQLWHRGKVVRTVGLRGMKYVGCLHVELPADRPAEEGFDQDLIGDFCSAQKSGTAEVVIPYVEANRLEIALPFLGCY